MSNDTIPLKKCTKCGEEKPQTPEYFHNRFRSKIGLTAMCKACTREKRKSYNIDQEKLKKTRKAYTERNIDRIRERKRRYERKRFAASQALRDKRAQFSRNYFQANREHYRIKYHIRQARKRQLPNDYTEKDWHCCLEYWHGCCAVCGNQLRDLFGKVKPHADHWIPLNYKGADNPGTVPHNMICLCSSCNSSKHDDMPMDWLIKRCGKSKARKILKLVEKYLESVQR